MNSTLVKATLAIFLYLLTFCITTGVAAAVDADEYVIQYGAPHSKGKFTTTVEFKWTDGQGKTHKKKITSTVDIEPPMTSDAKRTKVQNALQGELDKDDNKILGQPAASLAGLGATLIIDPTGISDTGPDGGQVSTGNKINKFTHKDKTGQRDKISESTNNVQGVELNGLAIIQAEGSLTGKDGFSETASTFSITTDLGTISRTIFGDMTKIELFDLLAQDLAESGFTVWLNEVGLEPQLFVLVNNLVGGIGATTTDDGLYAVLEFIGAE